MKKKGRNQEKAMRYWVVVEAAATMVVFYKRRGIRKVIKTQIYPSPLVPLKGDEWTVQIETTLHFYFNLKIVKTWVYLVTRVIPCGFFSALNKITKLLSQVSQSKFDNAGEENCCLQ